MFLKIVIKKDVLELTKIFNILAKISNLLPLSYYLKITRYNDIYPFYHIVNDKPPGHVKHLYPICSEKQFVKDLDFFLKYFKPESFKNIRKTVKPSFFLSFDDGLSESYNIVVPILKQKGIPATFFVNSDFIDNKDMFFRFKISLIFDEILTSSISKAKILEINNILSVGKSANNRTLKMRLFSLSYNDILIINELAKIVEIDFSEYLKTNKPYLTKEQIKSMVSDGFIVGAHSINHPHYFDISLEKQIFQTQKSIKFVTDNFNVEKLYFAFPFTDFGVSKEFFENIFNNNIVDFTFGTAGLKKDSISNNIQRSAIESSNLSANKIIKTQYLLYFIKSFLNKNTIYRY